MARLGRARVASPNPKAADIGKHVALPVEGKTVLDTVFPHKRSRFESARPDHTSQRALILRHRQSRIQKVESFDGLHQFNYLLQANLFAKFMSLSNNGPRNYLGCFLGSGLQKNLPDTFP